LKQVIAVFSQQVIEEGRCLPPDTPHNQGNIE